LSDQDREKQKAAVRAWWVSPAGVARKQQMSEMSKQRGAALTPEERAELSERMKRNRLNGTIPTRTPITEAEKELHRQRLLTNNPMSDPAVREKARQSILANEPALEAARQRMQTNNPMHDSASVQKMVQTREDTGVSARMSELARQRVLSGELGRKHPVSKEERRAISERMKANNPMKNPDVVAKMQATRKETGANERLSERAKEYWATGKFTSAHRRMANSRGMNKQESRLLEAIAPLGFRFTGDSTFWIKTTVSGISRNPDFIWQSGKDKTALLLNGVYWHTKLKADPELEINDYRRANWNLFILWIDNKTKGGHLTDYMIPAITTEVSAWLDGLKSKRLKMPDIHQFSTLNALLTITSS
jgi:hypothetical protein